MKTTVAAAKETRAPVLMVAVGSSFITAGDAGRQDDQAGDAEDPLDGGWDELHRLQAGGEDAGVGRGVAERLLGRLAGVGAVRLDGGEQVLDPFAGQVPAA
jgi:hypothetical protein